MGDLDSTGEYEHYFPDALFIEREGIATNTGIILADELLDKYNIKLISWIIIRPKHPDWITPQTATKTVAHKEKKSWGSMSMRDTVASAKEGKCESVTFLVVDADNPLPFPDAVMNLLRINVLMRS